VNEGPITRSRAKKRQQEVHAFLSGLHCTIDVSHILPKSCTLLLLRFIQEASPLYHSVHVLHSTKSHTKNLIAFLWYCCFVCCVDSVLNHHIVLL
jgi:hypothetical protein